VPAWPQTPGLLDELVAMGEVVWIGRGALGASDGRGKVRQWTDRPG
jgi:hypothetical protein